MIRPVTIVCALLAGASGLYLYQTKHRAQVLDREIGNRIKQTEATRERIGMLKAEWALLNEPERLAELVKAHTGLRTLAPTQFVAVNDLASRLPAPVAPTPPKAPTDVEPEDAPAIAQAAPAPKPGAPARPAPTAMAAATPASAPALAEPKPAEPKATEPKPQLSASEPKSTRHARPAPVQTAAAAPAPPVHAASQPVRTAAIATPAVNTSAVAPGTIGESVLRAMRANATSYSAPTQAPAAAYVQPVVAASPSYASSASYAPSGSLLGSARSSLPPPVPYVAR